LKPLKPLSPTALERLAERLAKVERTSSSNAIIDREETDHEKIVKFARYRMARAKKVNPRGEKTYEDVYDYITREELDYYLKKRLQVPPEQRYQQIKQYSVCHSSSWYKRGLKRYDGHGCDQFYGCVPECRYYPDEGRIEDHEIIAEYDAEIAKRRKEGTLIEDTNNNDNTAVDADNNNSDHCDRERDYL
jgi:hypothetical protein